MSQTKVKANVARFPSLPGHAQIHLKSKGSSLITGSRFGQNQANYSGIAEAEQSTREHQLTEHLNRLALAYL